MGQSAYAIMYGIEQPEDVNFFGEDYDEEGEGLCAKAQAHWRAEIAQIDAARKPGWTDPYGDSEYIPDSPHEADPPLLGFYVAVSGSGMAGVADLIGFAIDDIAQTYGDEIAAAKARWERFAAFAMEQGDALPAGRLWMTWTETA